MFAHYTMKWVSSWCPWDSQPEPVHFLGEVRVELGSLLYQNSKFHESVMGLQIYRQAIVREFAIFFIVGMGKRRLQVGTVCLDTYSEPNRARAWISKGSPFRCCCFQPFLSSDSCRPSFCSVLATSPFVSGRGQLLLCLALPLC